jgi:hypothetical protein
MTPVITGPPASLVTIRPEPVHCAGEPVTAATVVVQLIQGLFARVPIRQEAVDAAIPQPATAPDTSAEKLTRLLTWMVYRMAVSHIAEICRVLVETIDQILRKA